MKICIVAEGCYPYVVGGVSGWIHSLIQSFPNLEFIILAIVANRSVSGKFVYELPKNVTEVHELYLDDKDWGDHGHKGRRIKLKKKEYRALRSLVLNQDVDWETLFSLFQERDFSLDDLLMGEDFFHAASECYRLQYPQIVFSDFLWTLRSIYLPMFLTLKMKVPKADLYHCVATGYAGILGSMAKTLHGCRLLISEHGIYTREREEELIKAKWVDGIYKNIWIDQFKKMSKLAYQKADLVTSLYEHARGLQIELGCPPDKTKVTPNGVNVDRLQNLEGKSGADASMVNVGAVLRVTPIKDVKTMIQAFGYAKEKEPRLKLWIMGPVDEEEDYAKECFDLVEMMQIPDITFTGRIDVRDYLGKMDLTILTSISEGQPLTILESYAAHKPVIATDVGNCRGLIFGENDDFGPAGILTHIMNVEEIARALVEMAQNPMKRQQMGENGYRRVMKSYRIEDMKATYQAIYQDFAKNIGLEWDEKPFVLDLTAPKGKERRKEKKRRGQ